MNLVQSKTKQKQTCTTQDEAEINLADFIPKNIEIKLQRSANLVNQDAFPSPLLEHHENNETSQQSHHKEADDHFPPCSQAILGTCITLCLVHCDEKLLTIL